MELHQVIGVSLVLAMAFVVDSTVKLFRFRRRNRDSLKLTRLRDLTILIRPNEFPPEEARLTYRNWIACGAFLALLLIFLAIKPESLGGFAGVNAAFGSAD